METYQKLIVWQKSIDLVEAVYLVSRNFHEDEKFNLTSQIRRSAVSIPSNIAEGHGRKSNGEFSRFLKIAFGSSSELETQILIAYRLKMLSEKEYDELTGLLTYIRKMFSSLITKTTTN